MDDPGSFGQQLRLLDRFGDNGMIAVATGRKQGDGDVAIDPSQMSCRVLGREVGRTTLNLLVAEAGRFGARRLIGGYVATKRNARVQDHDRKLGFAAVERWPDSSSLAVLGLRDFTPAETSVAVIHGIAAEPA